MTESRRRVELLQRRLSPDLPDTIRYTFQYHQAHYTQGVWADIERLKDQGFELHKLKNSWSKEEYQGINSQWIEPDTRPAI